MKLHSASSNAIHMLNRTAVLEYLRLNGDAKGAEIACALGLDESGAEGIFHELTQSGLVAQYDDGGHAYRLDLENNLAICIDVGGTKMHCALVRLNNQVLFQKRVDGHGTKGEASYELLLSLLKELEAEAKKHDARLFGAVVGIPGVVDNGHVSLSPNLGWTSFPLSERLKSDLSFPVEVENDLNLHAIGEWWYGFGRGLDSLAFIACGTAMGVGLILNGAPYSGAHGQAGEMGYLMLNGAELDRDYPGFGAMEQMVSGTGLGESARKALKAAGLEYESADARTLFKAHQAGERWAAPIVDELVDRLALLSAAIAVSVDPEVIVFGGGVFDSAHYLLDRIRARVAGKLDVDTPLEVSALGKLTPICGGIACIIRRRMHYCTLTWA